MAELRKRGRSPRSRRARGVGDVARGRRGLQAGDCRVQLSRCVDVFLNEIDPAVEWHPLNQVMFGEESTVYRETMTFVASCEKSMGPSPPFNSSARSSAISASGSWQSGVSGREAGQAERKPITHRLGGRLESCRPSTLVHQSSSGDHTVNRDPISVGSTRTPTPGTRPHAATMLVGPRRVIPLWDPPRRAWARL